MKPNSHQKAVEIRSPLTHELHGSSRLLLWYMCRARNILGLKVVGNFKSWHHIKLRQKDVVKV